MPSMTAKSLKRTIERIIKDSGLNMEIVHSKVEKRIPADSAPYDNNGMNTHDYSLKRVDVPESKDEKMKKDLDLTPYYYERAWDTVTHSYVTVPRRLIKKG